MKGYVCCAKTKPEVVYFYCPSTVPNVRSCLVRKGGGGKTNEVLPVSGPVLQERVRRGSHGEVVKNFESAAG